MGTQVTANLDHLLLAGCLLSYEREEFDCREMVEYPDPWTGDPIWVEEDVHHVMSWAVVQFTPEQEANSRTLQARRRALKAAGMLKGERPLQISSTFDQCLCFDCRDPQLSANAWARAWLVEQNIPFLEG